jgi:hypothetical protein
MSTNKTIDYSKIGFPTGLSMFATSSSVVQQTGGNKPRENKLDISYDNMISVVPLTLITDDDENELSEPVSPSK